MADGAGKTISVRMPEGSVDELRAATGLPFSTLVRYVMLAYLERLRRERRTRQGGAQNTVAAELRETTHEVMREHGL